MIPNKRASSRRQMHLLAFLIQRFEYARESITSCETRRSKPVSNLLHSNQTINCLAVRRERRSPENLADHRLSYSKNHQGRMFCRLQVGSLDFILGPGGRSQEKELGHFCTDQGTNRWYYLSHRGFALPLAKRTAKRRMDNKAQWDKLTSARISETSQDDTLSLLWKSSLRLSIYFLCSESRLKSDR